MATRSYSPNYEEHSLLGLRGFEIQRLLCRDSVHVTILGHVYYVTHEQTPLPNKNHYIPPSRQQPQTTRIHNITHRVRMSLFAREILSLKPDARAEFVQKNLSYDDGTLGIQNITCWNELSQEEMELLRPALL